MPANRKPISRKQAREINEEDPFDDPALEEFEEVEEEDAEKPLRRRQYVDESEEEEGETRPRRRSASKGVVKHSKPATKQKPRAYATKEGHVVTPWNDVTIQGYTSYVKDIQVLDDGTPFFSFSVGVWQGKKKRACYMNVTLWGDIAEEAERDIVDGLRVLVKGRLTQRKYEGTTYTGINADYYELVEEDN